MCCSVSFIPRQLLNSFLFIEDSSHFRNAHSRILFCSRRIPFPLTFATEPHTLYLQSSKPQLCVSSDEFSAMLHEKLNWLQNMQHFRGPRQGNKPRRCIIKHRHHFANKRLYMVKAIVFPVVICGCSGPQRAECQRITAFELWR